MVVLSGVGWALLFLVPILVLVAIAVRSRAQYREASSEPFTNLPLRPPGESLRLKIESLDEQISDALEVIAAAGLLGAIVTMVAPAASRWMAAAIMFILAAGVAAWKGRVMLKRMRERWNYRLGFTGERVVGEELNQLMASGFRVFHDLPFDGFNIDHVLVGPPGVFAVETKTRRKPADIKGIERAQVFSDGERLRFPKDKYDSKAIPQARRNAETMAKWLTSATGQRVTVSAILTLPGWMVTRKASSDVNVLNPIEIKKSFRSEVVLQPDDIQRIAHQLTERCRIESGS